MEARAPSEASAVLQAASWIRDAAYLLITAGAGMSVDSGLPDFRGPEGFWRAYPPFRGKRFEEMSNPEWFEKDPRVAWGFFGHRLQLYAKTVPHDGYRILKSWSASDGRGKDTFVFTSNVDGAFQKAGFAEDRIVECHGAGTRLQCTNWKCVAKHGPYATPPDLSIRIDMETMHAWESDFPVCPTCGALSRPNILMFRDFDCDMRVVDAQRKNFAAFLDRRTADASGGAVVVELGAGTFVTTIRELSERIATAHNAKLIRINLRESEVPGTLLAQGRAVGLALGALDALQQINSLLSSANESCEHATSE